MTCATIAQAAPDAGTVIGNQAVATYVNGAGDTITVTSNKVETVVQQVAGLTLTADNSEQVAPGGKAFLPHTLTNDGNGPDSFTLSASEGAGGFDFSSVVFYADANLDGVADSATPITTTPVLAPGESFGIVIDATVPATALPGQAETLTVLATSALDGGISATNTDTLTIANGAIMELSKSMVVDRSSGDPTRIDAGDTVTITLTYSNTGLAPSSNYLVEDLLDDRLVYSAGTAQWSDRVVAGGLSEINASSVDATNGAGATIAYRYDGATMMVDFLISSVPSGRTGSVTFQATIASDVLASTIQNTALQSDAGTTYPPSNTAQITVDEAFALALSDSYTLPDTSTLTSSTDDGPIGDDTVTESTDVSQGGKITFEFVLGNDSNQVDSYILDVTDVDFPPGTTFSLVGSDGVTPIVGPIEPLAPGEATTVTLIATLPSNATPTDAGLTGYTAIVTATSVESGLVDPTTAEFTGAVLPATVDLQNADATGDGAFPTNIGDPWSSLSTDPGEAVVFPLRVENLGPTSDSYTLSLLAPLPAGWTVEFQLADGTVVTNTGTIPAGGFRDIVVVITPSADALPGPTSFEVGVTSPVSGQSDSLVNEVVVNEVIDLSITPDRTVQSAPGGVVDILHALTNDGNVTITQGAISASGLTSFSGAVYWDVNGDGALDPGDQIIGDISDITGGLAPGQTVNLIYRVQTGAVPGVSELATISVATLLNGGAVADGNDANNQVDDLVVVVSGDVILVKSQAIDPACNGSVGPFSGDRQSVEPGQCVRYRIVAENTGTAAVTGVTINDIVPAYTTYETCGGSCAATAVPGTVDAASAPLIESSHGTLAPGDSGTLEFTVRVDG